MLLSTDTELLTALLADEPAADTVEALQRVLPRVRGAYTLVVLDELVVHAWDLAVATGQPYAPDPLDVAACQSFVDQFDPPEADGGLFGPPVPVAPDASPLDRLLGRTGRDPAWRPA